jgi:hypothetical protein
MRVNGVFPGAGSVETQDDKVSPDVLITALEALGAPEGNHLLLKVTG